MAVLTGNNQNLDLGRARRRVRALGIGLSSQDGHTENSEEESSRVSHTILFILWRTKPAVKGLRDRHWLADTFRHEAGGYVLGEPSHELAQRRLRRSEPV